MDNILSNREAELSVIGSMMHGADCDLAADDFTDRDLRDIFSVIADQRAQNKSTDLVTLHSMIGNTSALIEASSAAMPSVIKYHADMVRECSVRRRAGEIARELYNSTLDKTADVDTLLEKTRNDLYSLMGGQRQAWTSAANLATGTYDWLEKLSKGEIKPVGTGIRGLDRLIGGFFPGELTIIGAKPGTGKTVFGMVIALSAARQGKRVGIMNLEMLDTQYGTRILSNIGNVDSMNLRKGDINEEDWKRIAYAASELAKLPASFMFNSNYIEDLKSAVRDKDLDLLVVDYMQLVRTKQSFESERLRMGYVSWTLKELAIEKRIPVVVMSQLRRPDVGAAEKMPSMRDLRESGNLEADADGIILLHEPMNANDPYVFRDDRQGFDEWKNQGLRYIAMKVEKQRQGNIGTVPVLFDGAHMRYREIMRDAR